MNSTLTSGLLLILLAGLCQGSFMVPAKGIRGWAWENYWLVFAFTAYFVAPWMLAFSTIPNLLPIYSATSARALLEIAACGIGWGLGALTFGLGVTALGVALGFAIIVGTAAVVGALVPLFLFRSAKFSSEQACFFGVSLFLMVAGVVVCSVAGKWKEAESDVPRSYRRGVAICLASGVLSACGNIGLVFGREVTRHAEAMGVPPQMAPNAVWTLLTLPLFICNAAYSIYLMRHNSTARLYRAGNAMRSFSLAVSMGVLWMGGFELYGMGVRYLGRLGPSLGWAILMASVVLVANGLGIATGEWKKSPPNSRLQLASGIVLLVIAIAGLGFVNG